MANNTPQNGIGQSGVSANGQVFSWDDFNKIDPRTQRMILANAGVPQDQIDNLLKAVQKMEVGEFQDYQANQRGEGGKSGSWGDALKYAVNPMNWGDTNFASKFARKEQGSKESASAEKSRQYSDSGLGSLIDQINTQSKQNAAAGITSQQPGQGYQDPWSTKNLNDYWNNFAQPIVNNEIGAIDKSYSDMMGQMRNMPSTAAPGLAMMKAGLENEMRSDALAQTLGPYMQAANNAMSGAFSAGNAVIGQGYGQQAFQSWLNSAPPAVRSYIQQSGGIPGLTSSPTQGITSGNISQIIGNIAGGTNPNATKLPGQ